MTQKMKNVLVTDVMMKGVANIKMDAITKTQFAIFGITGAFMIIVGTFVYLEILDAEAQAIENIRLSESCHGLGIVETMSKDVGHLKNAYEAIKERQIELGCEYDD